MGQGVSGLGSTKSMLSGMKRLRWDVWLEASGVPTDHCGVAMGVLEQRIDSAGADKGMSRASYFARAGRLWLLESICRPSSGAEVRFLMQSIRVIGVPGFQNDADRGPVQVESVCSETEDGSRIAIVGPAGSCRAHQKPADRRSVPVIARSDWGIILVRRWFCRRVWAVPLR